MFTRQNSPNVFIITPKVESVLIPTDSICFKIIIDSIEQKEGGLCFYYKLAANLMKKLPTVAKKINSSTSKDYYAYLFNNKRNEF